MPDWKDEISKRLSSLRLAPTREAEIIEELAQQLDDRYQQSLQGGATKSEAYQAAPTAPRSLLLFRKFETDIGA